MKTASRFAASLALFLLASTSRAALVDLGNGLINHPAANLTWAADANLFQTMAAADSSLVSKIVTAWTDGPIPTLAGDGSNHAVVVADFNVTTGKMNWYGARAWANYLRVTHYKGYSDWRLPEVGAASLQTGGCTTCVPGDGGFAVDTSEWWRLFFQELGGTANVPIASSNNGNYALFHNIEGNAYWGNARSGTSAALFRDGGEQIRDLTNAVSYRAWVVRVGQSIVDPPPAPTITFSPADPTFPVTPLNTPNTGILTLKNIGTAAATIASITGSGDFAVTHNCGTTLAMNATCAVSVTFKPTELLERTGTLTVDAGTLFTTTMTGTGGIAASISATPSTLKEGKSATITWSSSPHAVCEGIGGTPGWAGPLAESGSRDVTSAESGVFDFTISCKHDAGTLPDAKATTNVFFTNVAKGKLDWTLLIALTFALGFAVDARRRHYRAQRSQAARSIDQA
jgi:hypothetical protein